MQFIPRAQLILHNINPDQLTQLEAIFVKETKSGLEIPPWLRDLRETASPQAEKLVFMYRELDATRIPE
jgi:hypothetical protein